MSVEEDERNSVDFNDEISPEMRAQIAVVSGVAAVVASLGLWKKERKQREANTIRDRASVKLKIMSMNPAYFKRQYRLDRSTFMELLSLITPDIEHTDEGHLMGTRSSGSIIEPLIMLAITLRMLAGGSYLDIAFGYNVHTDSVYKVFHKTLKAIDNKLDNIQFPFYDEEKLRAAEQSFSKFSKGVFPGTVAAGDGIIFRTTKPSRKHVEDNVRSFYTRKGFMGMLYKHL